MNCLSVFDESSNGLRIYLLELGKKVVLIDGSGQKMEIAVENPETISFKIDKDGDGEFSDSETTIEKVEDFFDELNSEINSN